MIDAFHGKHAFLSNFWKVEIPHEGLTYPTLEHAFQAAKFRSDELMVQPGRTQPMLVNIRDFVCGLAEPGHAKSFARKQQIDQVAWNAKRMDVMRKLISVKFSPHRNHSLALALIESEPEKLVEGNYWHDNFWGDCRCTRCKPITGENNLGNMLMAQRAYLISEWHTSLVPF